MLLTGCIYQPSGNELRVSVMSRHTLDDGKTPDPNIEEGTSWHIHWPELGPPPRLIGSYYKRGLPWEEFERQYLEYLRTDPRAVEAISRLITRSRIGDHIILCKEETPERCHRRLIAEYCQKLAPELIVHIG